MLGAILLIALSGFLIGALARWAVPGPDPMPIWLTALIGIGGSAIGGGIATAAIDRTPLDSGDYFVIILSSIVASSLIVIAYRRFVQHRPLTGPEAYKLPTRGIGVQRFRQRLQQLGIDPSTLEQRGPDPGELRRRESLRKLKELHAEGLLTDEEYEEKVAQIESGSGS